MANKPFAIQGSDLTLGGVTLQAGATAVVIPGITQAVNYRVEAVDEYGSDNSQDLGSDAGAITVIDNSRWLSITTGNNAPSASYVVAEYSVDELDNGNIEEINVEVDGVFEAADKARAEAANMWATLQSNPFTGFNSANWQQIPFRPKLRADEVENIGGGGSITVGNGTDTSVSNVTEILINGVITEIEPGIVGITIDSGVTGDANVWVQDFTAGDIGPDAIISGATSVEYDADGNIIALFAVTNTDYEYTNTAVAKFDTLGVKQWELIFAGSEFTDGWGLAVDPEGNWAYVAGRTNVDLSYNQSLLTKIDLTDGSIEWSKQLDFGAASDSLVVDVAGDGNPVVVGYADNGDDNYIHVVKLLASDGSFIWGKTLDGYGDEEAYGMGVGPAGEVVVVGYEQQFLAYNTAATLSIEPVVSNPNWTTGTGIFVGQDFSCTVSFTDGVPTFTNIVDRVGNRTIDDVITTVSGVSFGGATPADDMTIKVASVSANNSQYNRVLVAKYAANGDLSWQKSIEIDAGYACTGADADIDSNGNIYVCGQFNNPDNNADQAMFLFQMNSAGVGQWTRKVSGNCEDFATSIVVGPDDHLYLAGVTGNNNTEDFNLVIAKYNFSGTVVWQRLLDNTTTWTFHGAFWFGDSSNGGSNLAVKNGYVAIAGGFADPFGTVPQAIVAQVSTDGTLFATGNYDFKSASFSGLLLGAPTIVDDIRVDGIVQPGITDFAPANDTDFGFLVGTLHVGSGDNSSINNNSYSVSVSDEGVVSMITSRGTVEFGALPELPTGPSHFHIMKGAGQDDSGGMDLYFGDDYNYVLQRPAASGLYPAYGVEIGAKDLDGGNQQVWRFGTDGSTTFPTLTVERGDNSSGTITGQTLLFGDNRQEAIISTPDGNVDYNSSQRLVINPGQGFEGGEGGDIYLWAGRGGASSGTGGDIKIRGGHGGANTGGGSGGSGGYIRIEAGDAPSTGGSAGYVEIRGGNAPGTGINGGNVEIISGSGAAGNGTVRISTIDHNWYFGANGTTTFPDDTIYTTGDLAIQVTGGVPNGVSSITGSAGGWELRPLSNLATTGGTGNGLTVDVTETGGYASAITIVTAGTGYTNGDVITVTSSGSAASFIITVATPAWTFGGDSSLTFPDATVQTTAYLGTASTTQIGGVKIDGTTVNITDGVISLNSGLAGTVTFKGGWNASTNTPTLVNGTGTAGWMYIVTTTGTRDLGAGSETFSAGALLVYDGAVWINVSSNSGVVSFNTRTGGITLTSGDVTTALGFTPYNDTNPTGYTTNLGTVTSASVASANGFAGTVATNTTTPDITISTSITGLLKGNGTAISAASSVTDYIAPYTSQTANYVLAAPNGSAGTPVFRAGVIADISNLGSGVATFLATPTSANLAAAITDETGTNKIVFSTSPTVTTSIITDSTSFDLLNTTATTVNFAGAATTALTIGASGAPITGFARTATTSSTASSLGYLGLPQSATATTATLAIGDTGKHIYVTTAGQTITIPANASVAYPIGSTITFIAGPSATTVSIAITSDTMRLAGGALTGTRTLAANGMATAVKVAATTWYINGTGLT